MKLIILALLFIACEKQDSSPQEFHVEQPRIILGSTYNYNGDDYDLSYDNDYDSYTQVIKLTRKDANGLVEYKEMIRLQYRLRVETESTFNSAITTYLNGGLKGGKTRDATIFATETNFEICRKEIVNTEYEWQCETFEEI
tara:strand:+ start:1129 stop:1551 length:423 start_codon:yes stop_codon:yes gene_type:complete